MRPVSSQAVATKSGTGCQSPVYWELIKLRLVCIHFFNGRGISDTTLGARRSRAGRQSFRVGTWYLLGDTELVLPLTDKRDSSTYATKHRDSEIAIHILIVTHDDIRA